MTFWQRVRRFLRSSLSQPDEALREALGVSPGPAGVVVNEKTALRASAVWACIRLLAGDLASVPLILYRRRDNGKERADSHPLYAVLHDAPNDEIDSFRFVELMMTWLLTWGNAYAEVVADEDGRVRALWPLAPWLVMPERARPNGQVVYRVQLPEGGQAVLPRDQILHVAGLGYDGLVGYSPIRVAAREAIGLALATQEYGARFFSQGARPGIVLEHPGRLSDKARENLRQSWEALHGGLSRSHRVAILEEGMKLSTFGVPPEDSQFVETRKFQVTDIARIFGVPPHMIGDHEKGATYASVEQQSIDYVTHTLRPWAVRIERAIYQQLLTRLERRRYFAEFLLDGLLRGDTVSRYRAYAIGRQWGWLSANDVRRLENMDPIDGGDQYLVPLNMIPAGTPPEMQERILRAIAGLSHVSVGMGVNGHAVGADGA